MDMNHTNNIAETFIDATLKEIADKLLSAKNIVICGHINPDGDCLGSQLLLAMALKSAGKEVYGLLASNSPVDKGLRFLPEIETLQNANSYHGQADAFVSLDVPNSDRLGSDAASIQKSANFRITIDHHIPEQKMSEYNYIDTKSASASIIVWQLIKHICPNPTPEMASCAYIGLMTDTGRFQHQNTNAQALAAAADMVEAGADIYELTKLVYQRRSVPSLKLEAVALSKMIINQEKRYVIAALSKDDFANTGAHKSDAEPVLDSIRSIDGMIVACSLRQLGGQIRGSFRSSDETNVAAMAENFGGGGHKAAAGFTLSCSLEEAVQQVIDLLDKTLESQKLA